jgi:hypothetical protein
MSRALFQLVSTKHTKINIQNEESIKHQSLARTQKRFENEEM